MKLKEYKYKINGTKFSVKIGDVVDNEVHVEVNGVPYTVELDKAPANKTTVSQPVKSPMKAPRTESGEKIIATPKAAPTAGYVVKAPLPGTLMNFAVKEGDVIADGATVCIIEAMKMENDIHAGKGGTVKKILVNVGDAVPQDGDIMIIE
ncbi:MAG: acetyl-CoA carboxylase biotin carboxyl carrier protein subunit [Muribaculaceae bacterium]|nr:acetyl-CoA carboxylase biotin carboxyl carrier protein subunit [Muribaculaceae bacterium]MDE5712120.1 acetyl-CoA carboxylase biotin carboxyl carrier protein subunit [Muribaculaceae bacterium]